MEWCHSINLYSHVTPRYLDARGWRFGDILIFGEASSPQSFAPAIQVGYGSGAPTMKDDSERSIW